MKKINSINYGANILMAGCVFGIIIPVILWIITGVWDNNILQSMMKVSFGVGIIIFVIFFVHLGIEFRQDSKIDKYYSAHKNVKIHISSGEYECGSCGSRQVHKEDTHCRICGEHFGEDIDKSPQEILDSWRK